jgi:hypothetical protein
MPIQPATTHPAQPHTHAALQAMQSIILAECLVGGVSPFAPLSTADATRYGVANAVFIGQPKDFNPAYLPQCAIAIPTGAESVALAGYAGRLTATFEATVTILVDPRADWYAAEQQILAIRDALWPALLHHGRLGGSVATVIESEARPGRGLGYQQIAGSDYRSYEARWWVRQQATLTSGRLA